MILPSNEHHVGAAAFLLRVYAFDFTFQLPTSQPATCFLLADCFYRHAIDASEICWHMGGANIHILVFVDDVAIRCRIRLCGAFQHVLWSRSCFLDESARWLS